MTKQIFLASNNAGKLERFRKLLVWSDLEVEIFTPKDLGLDNIEVDENAESLLENAELKARAYFGKVAMPILSNDTGFWVEGEGLVSAPKRIAFGGRDEKELSLQEKAKAMLDFWKGIAKKYGGKVNARWEEAFVAVGLDGVTKRAESKREVILTDQEFGEVHIQMPVRALYISKITGKPACTHTPEEEKFEMQLVIEALKKVLD